MMSRRYLHLFSLSVVVLCLVGCSDGTTDMVMGISFVWWVGYWIARLVRRGIRRAQDQAESSNREWRLRQAPERYEERREQYEAWIPECGEIMRREVLNGKAFEKSEAWRRAQEKSMDLSGRTLYWANILYNNNITDETHQATEELKRRQRCCRRCPGVNAGNPHPRCLILSDAATTANVDVRFAARRQ